MSELDIDVTEYSDNCGESYEMSGRVPSLVVGCIEFLLMKFKEDPEAVKLLERLRNG